MNLYEKEASSNFSFEYNTTSYSKQILSEKGTKRCIEDLMAIFGYHSTDWLRNYKFINNETPDLTKAFKIIENVYVAKGYASTDSDMHLKVQRINASKDDFFDYDFENGTDPYQGLPVTDVTYTIKNEKDEAFCMYGFGYYVNRAFQQLLGKRAYSRDKRRSF